MSDATPERQDCGGDAAAYVLGALDDHEVAEFRRHMLTCVVCRDEVATLETVVGALPMAAPQLPAPRGLKRRVMAAVRADAKAARASPRAGRLRLFSIAVPAPALAAVAAAVLVAAGIAVGALGLGSSGSSATRVVQASVTAPGTSASAVLRVSGGRGELVLNHMPPPPRGRIYQIWLERPGGSPEPTNALFSVTSTGSGSVDVPGNLNGVGSVLVTSELPGGSRRPTRAPVIVARLT